MRFQNIGLLVAVGLCAFVGASYWQKRNQVEVLQEKKQGLVLVNVLEQALYEDCHIKCDNTLNVPVDALKICEEQIDKKNAEVVVYCSNYQCASSDYAKKCLQELGFEHVVVYQGGIAEWYQKGLPVEGPCAQDYLKVVIEKPISDQLAESDVITTDVLMQKLGLVVAA